MPRWHPISISGYHIREAGSTAAQELAFTLKDGFTYVEEAIERGLDVDDFAPRLSFFFNAHIDFFEEIAKYRAARRIWAREMRERYGAKKPESMRLRFHTQTAGVSLTAQQPLNNVVRTTIEALAGGDGGDAVAAHQLLRRGAGAADRGGRASGAAHPADHRLGVRASTNTADPLGGSYFVEKLTDEIESEAYDYFSRIDELGGMVEAIRKNFPQREIADASFTYQQELNERRRIVVGVNDFHHDDDEVPILRIDPALERKQVERLAVDPGGPRLGTRSSGRWPSSRRAAASERNLMEPIIDAARVRASEGEMIAAMQEVFGTYTESPVF